MAGLSGLLRSVLLHPRLRGLDPESPEAFPARKAIIEEKAFLRAVYRQWYRGISAELPSVRGAVVEIGAGHGFLREYIPDLITSDTLHLFDLSLLCDGHALPFRDESLRAVVLIDALHHLADPALFFREATRCMVQGGRVILVEPWVTEWSRFVFRYLHHEPFVPDAASWCLPAEGPLAEANGALPWILFQRDRERFEAEFPQWMIRSIQPSMPFAYLLSGGVRMRSCAPGWSFPLVSSFERVLTPWNEKLALFATVVLERIPEAVSAHVP